MAKYQSTHTGAEIDAGIDLLGNNSATQGQVLTANGTGGASWQDMDYVPKTTTPWRVYATNSTGGQSTLNYSSENGYNAVIIRDGQGRAKISTPTNPMHIANKKYVDDGFVAKTSTKAILYGTNATDGSQLIMHWTVSHAANTIVMRDGTGHVRTADPEYQNDAVTKSYADNRFRYTHHILINEAASGFSASLTFASSSNTEIGGLEELPTTFMAANGIFNNGGHYYQIIGIQGSTDLAIQVYYINSDDSYALSIVQYQFGGDQQLTDTVY